ncbi:MAG: endonuclease [Eubacteriaceae bacterium]|jgi:endonuclease-3|nr:endonuclease [Eubacteriaceae bacterium]MDK2905846.1 endonuclease [Eubacteriaceae bacterium]MDK2936318.1 endonuclease [Eubacteriaceae bacterium]
MTSENLNSVIATLERLYGTEKCGLNFKTPFELLIATILSAQCTDVRVNIVTADLFKTAETPKSILSLGQAQLKNMISSCGLANTKAKNIILTCEKLLTDFNGIVPRTMAELSSLPGVGRKTANVVMSNAFGIPAIAVDTHVFRVAKRIGLAQGDNVAIVEKELMAILPREIWSDAHHWLIWHGRKCCTARNPKCEICELKDFCQYIK